MEPEAVPLMAAQAQACARSTRSAIQARAVLRLRVPLVAAALPGPLRMREQALVQRQVLT